MTATSPAGGRTNPATRDWVPEVFSPYLHSPDTVFARVAARSRVFAATSATGGSPVLVGSAAGGPADGTAVRARGELLERMGNVLTGRAAERAADGAAEQGAVRLVRRCSYDELRRRGVPALDPAVWTPDTPIEARQARQLWCTGRSLLDDRTVWVPAGAAFLHHRPPVGCTATVRAGSTGVAAHPRWQSAVDHAAWEILERELIRRSWCDPLRHPPERTDALPRLPDRLRNLLTREGLHATALLPPAPAGTAAVVVCLHAADGRHQSFGARCGATADGPALAKAADEALMVRWSMGVPAAERARSTLDRTGVPRTGLEHALWAYRRQDSLRWWLSGTAPGTVSDGNATRPSSPVAELARYTGLDVVAVECSTGPARDEVTVVRLVAPGARPLPARAVANVPPHPFG